MSDELRAEVERLKMGLWDVWVALGHDTDGDTGPGALISGMGVGGFIGMVLRDAEKWRRESEEDYDADTSRLEARAKAVEAKLEAIQEILDVDGQWYSGPLLARTIQAVLTGVKSDPADTQPDEADIAHRAAMHD